MRKQQGCAVLIACMMASGCAELQTAHQFDASNASSGAQPEPTNLLLSLRHDPNYGLIQYAEVEVLYRDLTKAHPSGKSDDVEKTTLSNQSSLKATDEEVVAGWKLGGTGLNMVEALAPVERTAGLNEFSAVTVGISADRNSTIAEQTEEEITEKIALVSQPNSTPVEQGCNGAGGVQVSDEIWLASRESERWTIQIVSSRDADAPCIDDEFLATTGAEEARSFSVYYKNELWNVAVVGDYATSEQALAAAAGFNDPWIREIGDFRERRCNSVDYMSKELQTQLRRWCSSRSISDNRLTKSESRRELASAETTAVRSPYAR